MSRSMFAKFSWGLLAKIIIWAIIYIAGGIIAYMIFRYLVSLYIHWRHPEYLPPEFSHPYHEDDDL